MNFLCSQQFAELNKYGEVFYTIWQAMEGIKKKENLIEGFSVCRHYVSLAYFKADTKQKMN